VNVSDLKGGKQYKLTIQATNVAGTQNTGFQTPYVREFENIAHEDNLIVGAVYNPWFENPCVPGHFCHWGELQADFQKGTTPLGTPLRQHSFATHHGSSLSTNDFAARSPRN
jgi:hypothetical protein